MTAQMNDKFQYRRKNYAIAGISEGDLFEPDTLDMKPAGLCSACWRGYVAEYGVKSKHLVLHSLKINLLKEIGEKYEIESGPPVNSVRPHVFKGRGSFFNNVYKGINLHLEYSGGLLLADGFIQSLYVHMGFHPAWKYETVIELVFENGVLTSEYDRSEKMAEIRALVAEQRDDDPRNEPTQKEISDFIERAFDRRYDR